MSALDEPAPPAAPAVRPAVVGPPGVVAVDIRALVDGMLEGAAFVDATGSVRYANGAAAQFIGTMPTPLSGQTPGGSLAEPGLQAALTRCRETGDPERFEAQLAGSAGSARWAEFSLQPLSDGVLVLMLDTSSRHAASDADTRLRAAFESVDLVAIVLDPAGKLTYANDALWRTSGWTGEEVLGEDWFERFTDEEVRSSLRAEYEECVRTGEVPRQHEHDLVTRDGRRRRLVWNSTILRDGTGAVTAVTSVGDDVTDRRALEAAFRETSVLVEAALDASDDSIAMYRPVFDEAGRLDDVEIVHANSGAIRRWAPGLALEDVRGRRLFEVVPAARDQIRDVYGAVVETGQPVHMVREFHTPGGLRTIDVTVTPYEGGFVHVGRDITELLQTGAELRQREAELRRTLGSVDAIISSSPREGGPLTVSPQIERILGWTPAEVPSFRAWNALIHPDDLPACEATWSARPEAWTLQYRMRRADGTYAAVVDRGRRFMGEAGERGTFGVVVDVTARVAADAALAESEARLREIVDGVDAIVAFQDREGTGLQLSPQIERILGWRAEEVPDFEAWHALVHPDDLAACLAAWAEEPPAWHLEYRMRRAEGGWAWVVDRGRRIPTADGSGTYTYGIIVDVTAGHEADEALRRSEERQRRTIDSLDAIVAIQEHADAPLISSPQLERILGIDPATMTRFTDWRALVHPDDLPRCLEVWADRPPTWEMEYRMRHADGHYVWVFDRGRRIARADGLGEGTFGIVVDVTDRHAAAEALRASEERLRRMVEGVDAIISYQEAWGDPVLISPQSERILGYSPEHLTPFESWDASIHPDDIAFCHRVWDEAGPAWEMDYRMRRADGTWAWVNDRGVRIPHDDGRGAGLFGVITDVTAQHEAADRLRASEARFRAMFEEIPEAIGVLRPILDADGRCTDAEFLAANRTTRERWLGGVAEDGVAGIRLSSPRYTAGDEVRAAVARVAEQGGSWRDEVRTDRAGAESWSDLSVFPFEAGIAVVARDVTIRRNAEEAARSAAAFQHSVMDSMAEGLLIVGPDGRVASANARAAAILGYRLADLTGRAVGADWDSRHTDGTPFAPEEGPSMAALLAGRSSRGVEISARRPDGERLWLRVNSEPLRDRSGTVIAAVSTFTDITVEHEMVEQLRRAQRMEAVGQLAGGVAHDFNNLLAAIRGYTELALDDLPAESPVRRDLEEAVRASERAAALTRQLLLFSRREVLAPRPVDPAEVIDGVIPMLRQLVGEHIELAASRDARTGVVLADPGQLEQVIVNLVVNARDAIPGGGRIEVRTRRTDPGDATPADAAPPPWPGVRIQVADTGQGIDAAALPHIFEPFFTTKEAGRGSGMGLATVYGIVGASGGTVMVDTSPGQGTTFTIDLPVIDTQAGAPPAAPEPGGAEPAAAAAGAATMRGLVLLVEDDVAVRAMLARQLRNLGWRVEEQASGTAAADAARSGALAQPDLLVTDVRMPGVQGPDLARRLRMAWADLPILFITGLADEVDADEPWVHVLTKPFNAAQLGDAIETVLSSRP